MDQFLSPDVINPRLSPDGYNASVFGRFQNFQDMPPAILRGGGQRKVLMVETFDPAGRGRVMGVLANQVPRSESCQIAMSAETTSGPVRSSRAAALHGIIAVLTADLPANLLDIYENGQVAVGIAKAADPFQLPIQDQAENVLGGAAGVPGGIGNLHSTCRRLSDGYRRCQ